MKTVLHSNLTNENYFSQENSMKYMGCSQFKSFQKCEAAALADVQGFYQRETTTALLVGSYVDAHFEGTLDIFKAQHPEIFTKNGSLKSEYAHANYIIERVEKDKLFMHYMSGKKQVIMTGEICGVPVKIKVDSLLDDTIVDLKCMRDFAPVWNDEWRIKQHFLWHGVLTRKGRFIKKMFAKTQIFSYHVIAGVTKEKPEPDWHCLDKTTHLDFALGNVEENIVRYQRIKQGLKSQTVAKNVIIASNKFKTVMIIRRWIYVKKNNFMGRLGRDPELKSTNSNIAVCKFTVAVNRPYQKDKEKQADFINVTAWRGTAEFVSKYFNKGSIIIVEGKLQNNDYTDKDGVKHYSMQVMADNFNFGGSKSYNSSTSQAETNSTSIAQSRGCNIVIGDWRF